MISHPFGVPVKEWCLDNKHRWQPYLRKLCEFWDFLCDEGKRYAEMVHGEDHEEICGANMLVQAIYHSY